LAFTIEVANIDNGGFHPKPKYIINQSRENLCANLYMLEIAELAKAAKALKSDTIDIGVPGIVHLQPRTAILSGKDYQVTVDINDTSNLKAESLMVVYRTRPQGGNWGDWQRVELMPKDVEGRFAGSIPGQDGGTAVQYYFVDKDTRGPSCYDPQYGFAAPYSYTVTGYLGLGNFDPMPWVLLIIVIVVVVVLAMRLRRRRLRTTLK
jgi:hypothetical protein